MIDRDITISNLELNIRWIEDNQQHQFPGWGNVTMAMRDAAELLKEQEAKPIAYTDNPYTGLPVARCPNCGKFARQFDMAIPDEETHFCPWCGQAVKWEEQEECK